MENLSVVLPMEYEINCKALARYIIVDVLQNGGVLTEFLTFDSTSESFVLKEIRLINEKNRNYYLTNIYYLYINETLYVFIFEDFTFSEYVSLLI